MIAADADPAIAQVRHPDATGRDESPAGGNGKSTQRAPFLERVDDEGLRQPALLCVPLPLGFEPRDALLFAFCSLALATLFG